MLQKIKFAFIFSLVCVMASAQTFVVTPLNGIVLNNGSRAIYFGKSLKYDIAFETPGDTITSISVTVNNKEISAETFDSIKWTVKNYEIVATPETKEHVFSVIYTTTKDSIGDTITSTYPITVYDTPVKPDYKVGVDGNSAAIGTGTFNFILNGTKPTAGDPNGWVYTWEMTGQTEKIGETASWTVSQSKTYTVNLKAQNKINNSSDPEYTSEVYDLDSMQVIVYSDLSTSINRKNVIKGDAVQLIVNLKGGQDGKWLNNEVTINGNQVASSIKGNELSFTCSTDDESNSYDVAINVENKPDGMSIGIPVNVTNTIYAWDKPSCKKEIAEDEKDLRGNYDPDYTMKVMPEGGCRSTDNSCGKNGWEYTWEKDKNTFENSKESFTISSKCSNKTITTYTLTAKNYVDGIERFSESYSWNISIWPTPSSPTFDNGTDTYFGMNTTLTPTIHGGYTVQTANTGWKLEWFKDGQSLGSLDSLVTDIYAAKSDVDSYIDSTTYRLKATNYWKDGSVFGETFNLPVVITVYSLPGVQILNNPEDIYYKDNIILTYKEYGGNPMQWERDIKYTNSEVSPQEKKQIYASKSEDGVCTIYLGNSDINGGQDKQKDITFYVKCHNGFGKNNVTLDEQRWTIHVWPKAQFADKMESVPVGVREGDVVKIQAAKPTGGYTLNGSTKASYTFTYDNVSSPSQTDTEYSFTSETTTGVGMSHAPKVYTCNVNILGPDNTVWDSKQYKGTVEQYRHPEIPSEVIVKGNGTSGTYVINMSSQYTNDILVENNYNYTYANVDGTVYLNTDKRYAVLGSIDKNTLCVATYWSYDDGSTIYSDFITYDGTKTKCSWSSFQDNSGPKTRGTAGDTDDIERLEENGVSSNGYIYNLNGQRVISPTKGRVYIIGNKKVFYNK